MELGKFIGNRIKRYRESRGMTQDMLAEQLNTTRQTISRYENGERKANQDVLFELSEIFNVKVDDFFPPRDDELQKDETEILMAAHIDDDATEEELKEIYDYIETIKLKHKLRRDRESKLNNKWGWRMDDIELLMSSFPELEFIADKDMPIKQKGFIYGDSVYFNTHQTKPELLGTISEEIAHYETSIGEIYTEETANHRKQERLARVRGHYRIVTPKVLIDAYFSGMKYYWELAEFLSVTPEFVYEAVQYYKEIYGTFFLLENYMFYFGAADTLTIEKAPKTIASSF